MDTPPLLEKDDFELPPFEVLEEFLNESFTENLLETFKDSDNMTPDDQAILSVLQDVKLSPREEHFDSSTDDILAALNSQNDYKHDTVEMSSSLDEILEHLSLPALSPDAPMIESDSDLDAFLQNISMSEWAQNEVPSFSPCPSPDPLAASPLKSIEQMCEKMKEQEEQQKLQQQSSQQTQQSQQQCNAEPKASLFCNPFNIQYFT